jgi:hypothetical protein
MDCHHPKRCLKETYPGSNSFIGKAFVYEEEWLSCWHCKRLLEKEEKGEEDDCSRESIEGEV